MNYFCSIFCMDFFFVRHSCSCEGFARILFCLVSLCLEWKIETNRLRRAWCGVDGTAKHKLYSCIFESTSQTQSDWRKRAQNTQVEDAIDDYLCTTHTMESITLKLISGIDIFNYRFLSLPMIKKYDYFAYSKQYIFLTIHLCLSFKSFVFGVNVKWT